MKRLWTALAVFLLSFCVLLSPGHADYFKKVTLDNITGGPLSAAKGGTGSTSAAGSLTNILPVQTGNSGRVLGTNGSSASWVPATTAGCSGCVQTEINTISGIVANDNTVDNGAILDSWISTHDTNQILHVTPGTYYFRTSVAESVLSNFELRCDPGAVFKKVPAMDDDFNEYFFQFVTGTNISVNGCRFEGLTTDPNTVNPGEQGIVCFSCHGFYVRRNYFKDEGDAAVRSTTLPSDSLDSNSTDTWIEDNIFDNVAQVTTTPAGSVNTKAGTSSYWVLNNKFYNLKWSLKACTRSTNSGIHIVDNEIYGNPSTTLTEIGVAPSHTPTTISGTGDGVELCSVSDVFVRNNKIYNTAAAGITQYTNNSVNHFDYGNYHISGNTIVNSPIGIRFSNDNGADGISNNVRGVLIYNNLIEDITGTGSPHMIIITGAGGVTGSAVFNNVMINPTSGTYMSLPGTGVTSANNVQN